MTWLLTLLISALLAALSAWAPTVQAQNPLVSPVLRPALASVPPVVAERLAQSTFAQLGQRESVTLREGRRYHSVPFSVRADEVVTRLQLTVDFAHSPLAAQDESYIDVLLNDEPVTRLKVSGGAMQREWHQDIAVDPKLVADYNQLTFRLAGPADCTDRERAQRWAQINPTSSLSLTLAPLPVANDLSLLPAPFFDKRDGRALDLTLVLPARPSNALLQAAGSVASWAGAHAAWRGALVHARDSLPAGHAIVLATLKDKPAGIELPPVAGASVVMDTHPGDPRYKVLYLLGRDDAELRRAVDALVLGDLPVRGSSALIVQDPKAAARQPNDAPNWLAMHRPVRFDELVAPAALDVTGQHPGAVRLDMRLPPDLFLWRSRGVPVDLYYRYTPQAAGTTSSLNVQFNGEHLRSYRQGGTGSRGWAERMRARLWGEPQDREARLSLPPQLVGTQSHARLSLAFSHDGDDERADCQTTAQTTHSVIDGRSTVDFSGLSHYLPLPDLAAFANAGYPFTRWADLSQTAVVLPEIPAAGEVDAYLTLMGRMGEATGYPARQVRVVRGAEVQQVADRELILIGTPASQPLLHDWAEAMRFSVSSVEPQREPSMWQRWAARLWQRERYEPHGELSLANTGAQAALVGFESPLEAGRSVVALVGVSADALALVGQALTDPARIAAIRGHAVALQPAQRVQSYLADPTYAQGDLPWISRLRWELSTRPILLWMVLMGSTALLSSVLYVLLRRRSIRRLAGAAA